MWRNYSLCIVVQKQLVVNYLYLCTNTDEKHDYPNQNVDYSAIENIQYLAIKI